MIEILLIRHGKTYGNTQGRYIGSRTDEPLCEEGISLLKEKKYPEVNCIYVSPMLRCVQSAAFLWQKRPEELITVSGLQECDFGDFENKNYQELNNNPDYQAWIDSGGTCPFPGGESMDAFKARCLGAFEWIVKDVQEAEQKLEDKKATYRAAVVAHGGTIMSILERYGSPGQNYFDYQVKNGCGYILTPVEGTELWNYRSLQ